MSEVLKGMQMQLFNDLPIPKRPSIHSDEVTLETVKRILPRVLAWIGGQPSSQDIDNITDDLVKSIRYENETYDIMSGLDRDCGWVVNDELYDILNDVEEIKYFVWKEFIADWVLKNGIMPKHSIGDEVKYKSRKDLRPIDGEIVKINNKLAEYTVYSSSLGHVRKGNGTHGVVVEFESII
jgi:hypothetical protein